MKMVKTTKVKADAHKLPHNFVVNKLNFCEFQFEIENVEFNIRLEQKD